MLTLRNGLLACAILVVTGLLAQDDAGIARHQGLERLRASQSDHGALVPALKLLAEAAALYAEQGRDSESAEVNSCLYWAKKKMVLGDLEALESDQAVTEQLETATKPIAVNLAQTMMLQAGWFANGYADDALLMAICYFGAANRFKESDIGVMEMDKSPKAMRQIDSSPMRNR